MATVGMALMMCMTALASGWQWNDGNRDGTDPILANRAWTTENGVHISVYGYMQRELVETTPCAR